MRQAVANILEANCIPMHTPGASDGDRAEEAQLGVSRLRQALSQDK